MATLEMVLNQAFQLSTLDKVRLIEKVTPKIEQELVGAQAKPGRSLWGVCRDLGPAPSAEEMDEARREPWSAVFLRRL
jgi:hypothetical protein